MQSVQYELNYSGTNLTCTGTGLTAYMYDTVHKKNVALSAIRLLALTLNLKS